jgi:hypothetical protein
LWKERHHLATNWQTEQWTRSPEERAFFYKQGRLSTGSVAFGGSKSLFEFSVRFPFRRFRATTPLMLGNILILIILALINI